MPQTTFQIKSINIGKIEQLPYGKTLISTAIRKYPVQGDIFLTKNGLLGDEQAYKDHGGLDKALCVYSYDHYAYWSKIIPSMIDDSLFGENITVYGLTEETVHVGDIFSFGEAIIQISEPRNPCYKLAKKYNVPTLPLEMQQTKLDLRISSVACYKKEKFLQVIVYNLLNHILNGCLLHKLTVLNFIIKMI